MRAFPSNGNGHFTADDLDAMEKEAIAAVSQLLVALRIKPDHNTVDTPKRVAKMLVREVFAGRYEPPPKLTDFPNAKKLDELYTVGPLVVRSTCAHHFCPIEGSAWIGVIPGKRIIGISKFARITRWIMSRPQIQEEATVQLADAIEHAIKPRGLGIVIKARHSCMTWRGVLEPESRMTTSVVRGLLRSNASARSEFLAFVEQGQT